MKPLLSRSTDRDLVKGESGDPATTTTSVFAPFFDLLALLLARSVCRRCHMMNAPVPKNATTAAVTARFSDIQDRAEVK